MGFDLNLKDFNKYAKLLVKFPKEFQDFLNDFLIEMAERIIAKTKPRTPVDTGALKNSWEISEIKGSGKNIYVELINPMEYATDIEYGHRIVSNNVSIGWYEGKFMLQISIDEVRAQMPLRYKKEFNSFCRSLGID